MIKNNTKRRRTKTKPSAGVKTIAGCVSELLSNPKTPPVLHNAVMEAMNTLEFELDTRRRYTPKAVEGILTGYSEITSGK